MTRSLDRPTIHLRRAVLGRPSGDGFPFDLPALRGLDAIDLDVPVTILVGENGSGKSTVLEALAIAGKAITAGTDEAHRDATLEGAAALAGTLRLQWVTRRHRGFYLRAEDFFGFAKRIARMRADLEEQLARIDEDYADRSETAKGYARMGPARELAELRRLYGEGLDAQSHGESFLRFFGARFVPGGLYLLDEPEAPLSPGRQLSLLAMLREMVEQEAQVILATHSPILLAYPGARILSFDTSPLQEVRYEDLEHVTLTRAFLADPQAFLRHL